MRPVRIAIVPYLNALPLVEGLDRTAGVELIRLPPSRIAGLVTDGGADLGLGSIIDAARPELSLAVAPVGMIGCDGPTLTVRIYSRVPADRITRLHADSDSHTSVALARIVLRDRFGARPRIEAWPAATPPGPDVESLLLIGDKVVTAEPSRGEFPHQADLGLAWKHLTGMPFVYAAWMHRADRAGDPALRAALALLDRQRRRNSHLLHSIAVRHAPAHGWPADLAREYLGSLLRYDLGPAERAGAEQFIRAAAGLGLAPGSTIDWSDAITPSPGALSPDALSPEALFPEALFPEALSAEAVRSAGPGEP